MSHLDLNLKAHFDAHSLSADQLARQLDQEEQRNNALNQVAAEIAEAAMKGDYSKIDLFDIQEAETPHLKTIITAAEAAERDRQRHRKAMDRATYLETAEQRRAQARLLRARGLSWAEVGREMEGISATAARKLAER